MGGMEEIIDRFARQCDEIILHYTKNPDGLGGVSLDLQLEKKISENIHNTIFVSRKSVSEKKNSPPSTAWLLLFYNCVRDAHKYLQEIEAEHGSA